QNVLYRAIGQSDSLEVDALMRRLPPNSYLLLCSDGLWGLVEEEIIERTIRENPIPQEACDRLVALANTKGGKDNITAVMLHIPS
ncbi:MAG: serine/threonine-protein phosphatase, partial [Chloroflexota bacterium]